MTEQRARARVSNKIGGGGRAKGKDRGAVNRRFIAAERGLLIERRHNYHRLLLNSRGPRAFRRDGDIFIWQTWKEMRMEGGGGREKKRRTAAKETLRLHFARATDPPIAGARACGPRWFRGSGAPIHQDHVKATFLNQTTCHLLYLPVFPLRSPPQPSHRDRDYRIPVEIETFRQPLFSGSCLDAFPRHWRLNPGCSEINERLKMEATL